MRYYINAPTTRAYNNVYISLWELPKCLIALHNLKEYLIHLCNYPYCLHSVRWKYRLIKIVHRQIAMVHLIRHSISRIYSGRMHAYEEGNSVHFIFVIFAAIFTTNEKEKNKMEKSEEKCSARERNASNLAVRGNRKRKKKKKKKEKRKKKKKEEQKWKTFVPF